MKRLVVLLSSVMAVACASSPERVNAPQTTSAKVPAPKAAEELPQRERASGDDTRPFDLPKATFRSELNPPPSTRDRGDSATRARAQRDSSITAAIHKALVDDPNLSPDAKAVEVIVEDRKVVLHGRVKTEQERMDIDGKARAASGVVDVDDRIEVVP